MSSDELVWRQLDRFVNDLWTERRLNLVEVIEHLESADQQARDEWLKFLNFLQAECTGRDFSNDKQWGELLNLMQISRKLNHRTIKFKDILKNKHLIEANERAIKRLNESARLGLRVEQSLDELDLLIAQCHIELIGDGSTFKNLQKDATSRSLDALATSRDYLEDKCKPILHSIRACLNNELLANHGNTKLDSWRQRINKHESIIERLVHVASNLYTLKSKLFYLSPLMNASNSIKTSENSSINRSATGLQLEDSLDKCRQQFDLAREYCTGLDSAINQLSSKRLKQQDKKKLPMVKLVNSKGGYSITELGRLEKVIEDLDKCRKTLDNLMHKLRLEFGRFYFVNDLELLTIIALDWRLATCKTQESVGLLNKLFNNSICAFVTNSSGNLVIGVENSIGEVVLFGESEGPIEVRKQVILYSVEIVRILIGTVRKLRRTLRSKLLTSIKIQPINGIDFNLPVQLVNLSEYIKFTKHVESCLHGRGEISEIIKHYEKRLKELNADKSLDENDLSRFKKSAAISMSVHFLSIVMSLESNNVVSTSDWCWLKQVRYYVDQNDEVIARIADAEFVYKFDYLQMETNSDQGSAIGGFKRLISTRTTERCFLVASQAVGNFRLGASLQGPAGGGKTESIKALGYLLGCQVIVHNCDETNKSESLERLIWGLAHTGLWGCFDEFNRLSLSVLSQVSATLELAQASIRQEDRMIELANKELMCIDRDSAFFITLNPGSVSGKKYGGRRRLPANLNQLFVPIAVSHVQVDTIVSESIMGLLADFSASNILKPNELQSIGKSICGWLDWMRSKVPDAKCEWDLRLVMALLKRLKAAMPKRNTDSIDELRNLLINVIDTEVRPRLGAGDRKILFDGLKRFSLHSMEKSEQPQNELKILLKQKAVEMSLDYNDQLIQSALDLKDQLETHVGVLLYGPACSGKSTTWRLLQAALSRSIEWLPLNPKCWIEDSLLGTTDAITSKWVDGLLTNLLRRALGMLTEREDLKQVWLILDGPIDPTWIESLNSVFDDNQVLTLGSGEHLYLAPEPGKSVKLLLETDDLSHASPATISRLGAILHENQTLKERFGLETTFDDWINSDSRLLAVRAADVSQRKELLLKLTDSKQLRIPSVLYNCNPYSKCKHLMEMLVQAAKSNSHQVMFLNNVDLIEPDQGQAISFMELLRFVITYDLFYRPDVTYGITACPAPRIKFVLSVDSFDRLDQRILNQSHRYISEEACELRVKRRDARDLDSLLRDFERFEPITILTNSHYDPSDRRRLIELFSTQKWQLYEFCNSGNTNTSLEALCRIIELGPSESKTMFLLDQIECRLLDKEMKSTLYHQLNGLQNSVDRLSHVKFIHLSHSQEQSDKESIYWQSLGDVLEIEGKSNETIKENVRRRMIVEHCTDENLDWVTRNIESLMTRKDFIDACNQCQLDMYLETISNLMSKSADSFESHRRTLNNGLSRLTDFEQIVNSMRARCSEREIEMKEKEQEIGKLMKVIDQTLIDSREQKAQVDALKLEQDKKNSEILIKSDRVEMKLMEVQRLVDTSKSTIASCLKPEALNEIKGFRSPPQTVKDILDALFILLSVNDNSWSAIKSYLANGPRLKYEMSSYNTRERLTEPLLSKVENFISTKSNSFQSQQANRACKAIVPILNWILATIEYGRVLKQLRPLNDEMDDLKASKLSIDSEAEKLEKKAHELYMKIQVETEILEDHKRKFGNLQQELIQIKSDLQKAESVWLDLDEQSKRWRLRLASIDRFLGDDKLIKLSFSIATLLQDDDIDFEQISEMSGLGDLKSFVEQMWTFVSMVCEDEFSLLSQDADASGCKDTEKILQLLLVKVHLEFIREKLLFIDLDSDRMTSSEVAQSLSLKSLLMDDDGGESCVFTSNSIRDFVELSQTIEMELRLHQNKLILIEFESKPSTLCLDIIDFVHEKLKSQSSVAKVALYGRLDRVDNLIRHLLHPVKVTSEATASTREVKQSIVNRMIRLHTPELVNSLQRLNGQVRINRKKIKSLEFDLLRSLAAANNQSNISENVALVLENLHKVANILNSNLDELKEKSDAMLKEQEKYVDFAERAADFYHKYISSLGKEDNFCDMSVDKFIDLLGQSNSSFTSVNINFDLVITRAMQSLRPEKKENFRHDLQDFSSRYIDETRHQLMAAIQSLIDNLSTSKLMIILHEPAKSSPQLEVDEFFKRNQSGMNYEKLYATGESGKSFEQSSKHRSTGSAEIGKRCICVVNAHLAVDWLNTNLLKLLSSAEAELVVLVSESSKESELFNQSVLDRADVKYWHDEMALSLIERFALLSRSLIGNAQQNNKTLINDQGFCILTKQLVLFHVVCQELTKPREKLSLIDSPVWSQKSYSFDYNLLSLAFRTLIRLAGSGGGKQTLRSLLCNHLESIHYGGRMETLDDEHLLSELINRYLRNEPSAKMEMDKLID